MTIVEEIKKLKEEKDAVILAHYYVRPEVQEIADYIGDSFYLSKVATKLKEQTIVFCSEYDDLAVVCYINSTAALKEYSDVCVTSANAVKIVKELPQKNIFFIPDRNLAHYVASQVPEKNFVYNNGFCPTHERIEAEDVANVKAQHPDAQIVAHGECQESILLMADYVGSTSGIINYVTESDCQEFIVCTEEGVGYKLKTQNPDKTFYYPDRLPVCPNMKKNTLEKILHVLKTGENEVHVSDALRENSKKPLEKMLELAAK